MIKRITLLKLLETFKVLMFAMYTDSTFCNLLPVVTLVDLSSTPNLPSLLLILFSLPLRRRDIPLIDPSWNALTSLESSTLIKFNKFFVMLEPNTLVSTIRPRRTLWSTRLL